jgi:hypothetical protein
MWSLRVTRHIISSGPGGENEEGHELDAKTAREIPKKLIGRTLTGSEAMALLDNIG